MSFDNPPIHPAVESWSLPSISEDGAVPSTTGGAKSRVRIVLGRGEAASEWGAPESPTVPLDRDVTSSVDIEVDGRVVARGEVVIIDGKRAVRIVSLISGELSSDESVESDLIAHPTEGAA